MRWDAKNPLRADFDCDGRLDLAFLGRHQGRVYVGVVRASAEEPEILDFAVDPRIQEAICAEPAMLEIESLEYDTKVSVGPINGVKGSRSCKGLVLSGGECDSIHLFWSAETHSLDWWRS